VQYSDKIIFTGLTSCPQTHRTPCEQNSYKAHVRLWEHWGYIVHCFIHPIQVMPSKLLNLNISSNLHLT